MRVDQYPLVITTDAVGAGTVTSGVPLNGYIVEVRMANAGTAITVGGTTDFVFSRQRDAGTILALSNTDAPFQVFPGRRLVNEAGGTTAYALGIGPVVQAGVPIDDYLVLTVSSGRVPGTTATVYVSVEGRAV